MARRKRATLDAQIVLRVSPKLRNEIMAAADQDRRSAGSLIRCVLSDWVRARERA